MSFPLGNRSCVYTYMVEQSKMTDKLLNRYLSGEATEAERLQVAEWVGESEQNATELNELRMISEAFLLSDPKDGKMEIGARRRSHRRIIVWSCIGSAVAAVLAVGALFLGFSGRMDNASESNLLAVTTLSAPVGQQTETILTDGTRVCLNSGSVLEILPTVGGERRVRLDGEAFFDVAKVEGQSFTVYAGPVNVKVLGTAFDVNSYRESASVVLVRGSVKVESQLTDGEGTIEYQLVPGQMFLRKPETGSGTITDVEAEDFVSWTRGYIQLDRLTLDEILGQLKDYYGVRIDASAISGDSYVFSGKLELCPSLDATLDNLSVLVPVSYTKSEENSYCVITKRHR